MKITFSAASLRSHPQIRIVPLATLKPAPYNPRRIDRAALAGLTKSMERFGDVQPIVWNQRSGYIVGGHQRLKILKRTKVQEVAVGREAFCDSWRQLSTPYGRAAILAR